MRPSNHEVSREIVYSEMYSEMRRYRDYELTVSTWYIVVLIAILGAIVSAKFGYEAPKPGDPLPPLVASLTHNIVVQSSIALILTLLGVASVHAVHYAHSRYEELRAYTTQHLEPAWRVRPSNPKIRPRHLITHLIIVVATNYLIFAPPIIWGLIAGLISGGLIIFVAGGVEWAMKKSGSLWKKTG